MTNSISRKQTDNTQLALWREVQIRGRSVDLDVFLVSTANTFPLAKTKACYISDIGFRV